MTDADLKAGLVGQALQLGLPQARAVAIRAAAVGRDRQRGRVGEALGSEVLPPALDRGDGELGGVVVDPDLNPAPVVSEVIDPVGIALPSSLPAASDRSQSAACDPLPANAPARD